MTDGWVGGFAKKKSVGWLGACAAGSLLTSLPTHVAKNPGEAGGGRMGGYLGVGTFLIRGEGVGLG